MARIRTIKPDFFKNLKLYEVEEETGLPVRVAYAGLWTVADREGRFVWIPRQLKIDCLPYDEVDFSRVLDALSTRGFVKKYTVNDEDFGVIPGFLEHQVINNRESASTLPEPPDSKGLTREPRVDNAKTTPAQGKGKERKGKDIKGTAKKSAKDLDYSSWPGTPTKQKFDDWLALRKTKRAPVSQTVVDNFGRELTKAVGMGFTVDQCFDSILSRGWTGFEAGWLDNSKTQPAMQPAKLPTMPKAGSEE